MKLILAGVFAVSCLVGCAGGGGAGEPVMVPTPGGGAAVLPMTKSAPKPPPAVPGGQTNPLYSAGH